MDSFEQFYKSLGFTKYPFSSFSTENESEIFKEIFFPPDNYEPVKEAFDNGNTIFIVGNRGIGKTALIEDFKVIQLKNNCLFCFVDDFSQLEIDFDENHLLKFLLKQISRSLFEQLVGKDRNIKKLSKEQRFLLAFIYHKFYPVVNKRLLIDRINKIARGWLRTFLSNQATRIRFILNFGLNVGTNLYKDTIARHFSFLPPLVPNEIQQLIPEIPASLSVEDLDAEISHSLLVRVVELVNSLGFSRISIMFDKLDEDIRLASNAELVHNFYSPIMGNNKLLLQKNLQFVFTVWKIAYDFLEETVRTQKHFCPTIEWTPGSIIKLLNRRLKVFSNNKVLDVKQIFSEDCHSDSLNSVFYYSNFNPRDLWHLLDSIFREQYKIDPASRLIGIDGVEKGIEKFVRDFNYFEYYPKKFSSSNALNIQDFIRTLVKTNRIEFSFADLKDGSGKSGGSVRNYLGEMQKMGLIKSISRTDNGGYIYRIQDPKVQFMIEKQIAYEK